MAGPPSKLHCAAKAAGTSAHASNVGANAAPRVVIWVLLKLCVQQLELIQSLKLQ
jgi:hypothetical protein